MSRNAWLGWLLAAVVVALLLGGWLLRSRPKAPIGVLPESHTDFSFSVR